MKKNKIASIIIAVIVIIAGGYFIYSIQESGRRSILENNGLSDMDAKTILAKLENDLNERDTLSASVFGDRIELREGNNVEKIPIDEDKFYLSIAPYINDTHDCGIHSLITCRGELANKEILVEIVDDTKTLVYSNVHKTYANGFAGIWLPKNIKGTLIVTYKNKQAAYSIETKNDSLTCITTLKLT